MSVRTRFTGTYADYLAVQASKAALPSTREKLWPKRAERVAWFRARFAELGLTPGTAMCLGARYGEEVEALRSLGWDARGIDLVAFPPWVEAGDMNEPQAGRFDLIYSNAFDHGWAPGRFIANIVGTLRPGGTAVLHVASGRPGELETVEWDSIVDVLRLLPITLTTEHVLAFDKFYGLDTEIVCTRRRCTFVDAGSFDGDSVRAFRAKYPNAAEYEIHAFECDPRYTSAGDMVHFHPQAVSTRDGFADFWLGDPESSSLFRDKTSGNIDREHPVQVQCVDFSRWMLGQFRATDHVVLKIDIEGQEVFVLEKMLADGSLAAVKDLYVDFHRGKVGLPDERYDDLIARLEATGIPLHDVSKGHFLEFA